MPEIKNTFLAGKMNKSLDDRLLPEGEYRDALNIQVTKNDVGQDSNAGVVHTIKGNTIAHTSLALAGDYEVIGSFFDEKNNTIYWFVTNNSTHTIYKWNVLDSLATPIVTGSFLNFNKSNKITGINLIEDYLFWTDNRNQPRRIDVTKANGSYYTTEDSISVAKYAPYLSPEITEMSFQSTITSLQIEKKFVRFAYRYKFDDNTYSLISPFSAIAFKPKDEIISNSNEQTEIFDTSEYAGMVNGINQVNLKIDAPSNLGIEQIEILYKESDSTAIRLIDTKQYSDVSNGELVYIYKSTQPKATLPEDQLTRVFDNVPIKALAQEITGNRVIYGNITTGHDIDGICDYEVFYSPKSAEETVLNTQSLKQRRTYEVGLVFSDKYGRTSPVILSDKSLIYVPAKVENEKSDFDNDLFNGDSLKILFKKHSSGNYIVDNAYDAITNPLGWYSYKVVVKQQQQEYYNVYTSGVMHNGNTSSYIQLIKDNINKIPRDVKNIDLQNDEVASSNVRLYPKVLNTNSDNTNSKAGLVAVSGIGKALDLNISGYTNRMYKYTENPMLARLTSQYGVLSSQFAPDLAVFETEPFESSLDIYYETPTGGLVTDLNSYKDNLSLTAFSLLDTYDEVTESNNFTVSFSESNLSSKIVSQLYAFYDNNGTKEILQGGVTYEITDSQGNTTTDNNFELKIDEGDNQNKIISKVNFTYDSVTPANNAKTFYITASFVDGNPITKQITVNITNANPTVSVNRSQLIISNNTTAVSSPATWDSTDEENFPLPSYALTTFTVTDGSASGFSGVSSVTSSETHGTETNHTTVFGVSYNSSTGEGYIYVANSQHINSLTPSDPPVVVTITASDGTNTGSDTVSVYFSTSYAPSATYYQADFFEFESAAQACSANETLYNGTVTLYYSSLVTEPLSATNAQGLIYTDEYLSILAPSGWYKTSGGIVGQWQSSSGSGQWITGTVISCS